MRTKHVHFLESLENFWKGGRESVKVRVCLGDIPESHEWDRSQVAKF